MLICRLSPRLFLAFPGETKAGRQYVFCRELAGKSTSEAIPAVEAIVEGRYQAFLKEQADDI